MVFFLSFFPFGCLLALAERQSFEDHKNTRGGCSEVFHVMVFSQVT